MLTWNFSGGKPSKAALVGAKTVTGPGSVRNPTRPAAFTAWTKVEKRGLKMSRSSNEQTNPQALGGTWSSNDGGLAGAGNWLRLGSPRGWEGTRKPGGLNPRARDPRKEVNWAREARKNKDDTNRYFILGGDFLLC